MFGPRCAPFDLFGTVLKRNSIKLHVRRAFIMDDGGELSSMKQFSVEKVSLSYASCCSCLVLHPSTCTCPAEALQHQAVRLHLYFMDDCDTLIPQSMARSCSVSVFFETHDGLRDGHLRRCVAHRAAGSRRWIMRSMEIHVRNVDFFVFGLLPSG